MELNVVDNDLVFIVGMARTGTTLMARIFNRGSNVFFLNETHFMREYQHLLSEDKLLNDDDNEFIQKTINQFITIQRKDYYRKSEYQEYPEAVEKVLEMFSLKKVKIFPELLRCLFQYEAMLHGAKRPGDQTPNHVFFINQILDKFSKAQFVNMFRDPRAVVLSQKNKWRAAKRLKQPWFEIFRSRINYHPITQSLLWKRAVDSALTATKKWGDKKIKSISYEALVNEPETQIKAVCQFAGVEFVSEMLDVSVSMSSNVSTSQVSGMDPSLIDKWRTMLSPTVIFLVELICGEKASQLGYNPTKLKPNFLTLIFYILIFPFHIFVAYLCSAGRFKKPFHILRNIFQKN
ncbi:MAG: sulfotransferase [Desulfobacteraceae bacterium]|nr:sulfotransferase [Desulfobacteraceae bacterium]